MCKTFPLILLLCLSSLADAQVNDVATVRMLTGEFPIGVWTQSPAKAKAYKDIGINLYIGLWQGPTEAQLGPLQKSGMRAIVHQNEEGLNEKWKDTIVAWLQDDEPDNAQSLGEGKGWGPPVKPEEIEGRYKAMKQKDPRPVLLNLGWGVAWDGWIGRGVRTNKPEDYPQYVRGGDIISFDIYPITNDHKDVAGQAWYVAYGTERLVKWAEGKPVWAVIECTRISNPKVQPTPQQTRAMTWMALIQGAKGIVYFCHQFKPNFIEAAVLEDKEMSAEIARTNRQIQSLRDALFVEPAKNGATVTVTPAESAIYCTTRRVDQTIYVFAVPKGDQKVHGKFRLEGLPELPVVVERIDEKQSLTANGGQWEEDFEPYQVRLYRIQLPGGLN